MIRCDFIYSRIHFPNALPYMMSNCISTCINLSNEAFGLYHWHTNTASKKERCLSCTGKRIVPVRLLIDINVMTGVDD